MSKRPASKRRAARRAGGGMRIRLAAPGAFGAGRLAAYLGTIVGRTLLVRVVGAFVVLWLLFAAAFLLAERDAPGSTVTTYTQALYWSVAAFSTAGIADTPRTGMGQLIGAVWIVLGSVIFFGTIVATVTGYFMRPVERPVRQIIETIEYNLEHLDDLSVDELTLLKKTVDGLIVHMERLKEREERTGA